MANRHQFVTLALMPDARCPDCQHWSRRIEWSTAPGEPFPFRIVCPRCGAVADVAEVDYRLGSVAPSVQTCVRCSAPVPAPADPVYDDWTLVPREGNPSSEIVCPRCILLTELAARIGWEREHGYRWRGTAAR
jgi:DNA-directed RNA polymerase subunit RPC12/RpoP